MKPWKGWIANTDTRRPQIGRIRGESWVSNWDGQDDHLANVVLYSPEGQRIGRSSPAEGGPKTFEPACDMTHWGRIREPDFPLRRHGIMWEWGPSLEFLED